MKDWLEQNSEKMMYGLVIIVLLLLIAIFSIRDTMSKRISGLNEEKWALEETAAAKDKELAKFRAKEDESKTEITRLGAANGELSGRITSLDLALSDARVEIDRLDFVALLRKKNVEKLRNEIEGLKRSEAESEELISKLRKENAAYETAIEQFNEITAPNGLGETGSSESALPAVPDADSTIAIKISDASSLASVASDLSNTLKELSKLSPKARDMEGVISAMEFLAGFAGTAGELSLLVTPSEDPGIYMAFLTDGDAFDEFMSKPHGTPYAPYKFDEWGDGNEGKGWTFSASGEASPDLYIQKIPAGGRALVLIARHKEEIASMAGAAGGSSPRFEAGRMTSGADYYQIKFKDGFKAGDILDVFSFDRNLHSSMKEIIGDADRVLWTVTECSWTRDGDTVNFESYSDIFKLNPQLAAARRTGSGPAAIMGEGDLAYFLSVNTGFLMNCLFLGADDPAGLLIKLMGDAGGFAPISDDDVRAILTNSTLSVICAANGGEISTAYLELDTESPGTADRLFSLASVMGGKSTVISGWDSAITWPVPVSFIPDVMMAKRGGSIMIGLGSESAFGRTLEVPDSYKAYVSADNFMGVVMSSKAVDVVLGMLDAVTAETGRDMPEDEKQFYSAFMALRDSFDVICGNVTASDKSSGKIVFREGGDLLGTYMKLLTMKALEMDSATDGAEATKIVNDLRNLKSAALLFYADNLRWPTQDNVAELDKYTDRPIVAGGGYENVIIGPEYKNANFENGPMRVNIGVQLKAENGTMGIRKKLEAKADGTGLLNGAETFELYKAESMEVFMNMR